ncbi:Fn3-like domain-containing protein [Mycena indigotica]|uniref:beta-glucosidase n=1 Tax=Mycena indigotica TaxID=2126181 RepID=A0A8H6T2C9_9AGAR|nr:Fn3-like domain-containing protein [Mycena indigotica]KAF7309713.1 Fn3-like domain-containing protein [Mycena indigotica]
MYLILIVVILGAFHTCVISQNVSQASIEVPWRTNNSRVNNLVEELLPEEKIALVHHTYYTGTQVFAGYILSSKRLGIPTLQMADGEAGVGAVNGATAIPTQLNLAATFSRRLAYAHGSVAGKEARLLNVSILLAPRVNILRDPFDGSFAQGYSEDPYLNAQLGVEAVKGIQDTGTMANAKQFGPSSTGASNGDANSQVDLQVLHELYWSPHEALVKAGVASVMCSYSQVNGIPSCSCNEGLNSTLRGDFGFEGIVMSDWGATHSTQASIIAGLDLEMGSMTYYTDSLYNDIYGFKNLSESYLNRAVHRVLSTYDRFGILEGRGPQRNSTDLLLLSNPIPDEILQEHEEIAYTIAVQSGVLLKNHGVLPLSRKHIGVIGPTGFQLTNGAERLTERAYGRDIRKVPPLAALKQRAPQLTISSSVGLDLHGRLIPSSALRTLDGQPGLSRIMLELPQAKPSIDATISFSSTSALPANTSYAWTGQLLANEAGHYRVSIQRNYPLTSGRVNDSDFLNPSLGSVDTLVINGTEFTGYRIPLDGGARPLSSAVSTLDGWDENGANVYLQQGWHNITLNVPALFHLPTEVRLHWVTPGQREVNVQAAIKLAKEVDVPVVFAYSMTPAEVGMQLMSGFNDLISRVAAANPNTVVVLNNGDPVVMPWLDSVAGLLWMGHPGQEGGFATADLLLGRKNPQGRLPVTYPKSSSTSLTRNPLFPDRVSTTSGTAIFDEGLNVGYRYYLYTNTSVLFPFGYGLSYTSFQYNRLSIKQTSDAQFAVSFFVKNTGNRAGGDVPQLYIGPPTNSTSAYPGIKFAATALVNFDTVELSAGMSQAVHFTVLPRQLSFWNQTDRSWMVARGSRKIWLGVDAQTPVLVGIIHV